MSRRRRGKLEKLRRPKRSKSALVIARRMPDEREPGRTVRYRGPMVDGVPTVVAWTDGRFVVEPIKATVMSRPQDRGAQRIATTNDRALARMPDGLAQRVNDALERGETNG